MTAPTISCLMPVFDGERYLALALDSILAQTCRDFELVAVNDGSCDGSLEILERYAAADARVKVFTKPNGGIVSALNYGLERCRGRLIARMDCDDVATPERFAVQVAEFAARPDAVAVGGHVQLVDADGRHLSAAGSPSRVEATRLDRFPPAVANVQHSAGTFLASAMRAVGGYRSTFPHAEDYDLYLRLAEHGRFYNPDKLVLYYRVHQSSLSMQNLERQETSAALAELSAYARREMLDDPGDGHSPPTLDEFPEDLRRICPRDTARRYIAFRVWRRLASSRHPRQHAQRRAVLRDLLSVRSYRSRADRHLNLRIVLWMGRRAARSLKRPAAAEIPTHEAAPEAARP